MASVESVIEHNLESVTRRLAAACAVPDGRYRRWHPVGVTKYAELAWAETLISLGVNQLGESRPQQLVSRAAQLAGWVSIGT